MKKKSIGIITVLLLILCFGLTACSGGSGGGGEGGDNPPQTSNVADFDYAKIGSSYAITRYKGSETKITLPATHTDGTAITGIYYAHVANDSVTAPFEGTSVEEIHIPAGITSFRNGVTGYENEELSQNVFYGAMSLKKITVDQNNPALCDVDGVVYNRDKTVMIACPYVYQNLTVPMGVVTIPRFATQYKSTLGDGIENAFTSDLTNFGPFASQIETISLPSSVKNIDLRGARQLKSVDLSNTCVEYIALGSFAYCTSLESALLPNTLKAIGTQAFMNSGLKNITIPVATRAMDYSGKNSNNRDEFSYANEIFMRCTRLVSVTGPAQVLFGEQGATDVVFNSDDTRTNQFLACSGLEEINVNGCRPGPSATAYAVPYYNKDSGWCSPSSAAKSYTALKRITYINGIYNILNNSDKDSFAQKYPSVVFTGV